MLALGAIASLTTVAIVVLLAQTRIFYAMAHDGLLPPVFTRINHYTKTPWVSIIISGKHSVIHLTRKYFISFLRNNLCNPFWYLSSRYTWRSFIGCCIDYIFIRSYLCHCGKLVVFVYRLNLRFCIVQMRYRCDIQRPFRIPFENWLIPLIGGLLCILLLVNTSKGSAVRFAIWIAIGHIVYFAYGYWHSKAPSRQEEEDELEEKEGQYDDDELPPVYVIPDKMVADVISEIVEVEL